MTRPKMESVESYRRRMVALDRKRYLAHKEVQRLWREFVTRRIP